MTCAGDLANLKTPPQAWSWRRGFLCLNGGGFKRDETLFAATFLEPGKIEHSPCECRLLLIRFLAYHRSGQASHAIGPGGSLLKLKYSKRY